MMPHAKLATALCPRTRALCGEGRLCQRRRGTLIVAAAKPRRQHNKHRAVSWTTGQPESELAPEPTGGETATLPPVVNWFVEPRCNYRCKFCFATFRDLDEATVQERLHLLQVPALLREHGADKLTFVGGEPFLHPLIDTLIAEAKWAGLTTCVVTNGSILSEPRLRRLQEHLDWLAFSVDASNDSLHTLMGRGLSSEVQTAHGRVPPRGSRHLERMWPLWQRARDMDFKMKLNTVVCRVNLLDTMADLVSALQPDRWKVFQVLPIEGQNDGQVEELLISEAEFAEWVARNRQQLLMHKAGAQVPMIAEDNKSMLGSYAMLDAQGRFFSNATGRHRYSRSVFDVGIAAAWCSVAFDKRGFAGRQGLYDWGQPEAVRERQRLWLA